MKKAASVDSEKIKRRSRFALVFTVLAIAFIVIAIVNINTGNVNISVGDIFRIIFLRDGSFKDFNIIWKEK